jgi:phosphate transport system substrate-binding protein
MKYKNNSIVTLALLLAAAGINIKAVAQTATNDFVMPKTVPTGTKIQIDGSNSMQAINQSLQKRFQQQFPGTDIKLPTKYQGSDAAVKAVAAGKVDLASIGRSITPEETAKGIGEKEIGRSKIAIVVKENNLTLKDFAKIYRGEITDWSQLASAKGAKGKIKVIDRPNTSDTRRAFANYPVFQNGQFKTASTAAKLTEDSTPAMVAKLGQNDIGYAPADQVKNIAGIRAITLHGTQPDNPKYPFSQPLVYAYKNKDGKVGESAKAFLGYVSDPTGKKGVSDSISAGVAATGAVDPIKDIPTAGTIVENTPTASGTAPTAEITTTTTPTVNTSPLPWWWMLPTLVAGGGLLWWLNRKQPTAAIDSTSASYSVPTPKSTATIDRSSSGYVPTSTSTARTDAQMSIIDNLSPDLRQVWFAVNQEPTNFDSIVTRSQHSDNHVTSALSQLESMGLVTELPGRKYQRTH